MLPHATLRIYYPSVRIRASVYPSQLLLLQLFLLRWLRFLINYAGIDSVLNCRVYRPSEVALPLQDVVEIYHLGPVWVGDALKCVDNVARGIVNLPRLLALLGIPIIPIVQSVYEARWDLR